MNMHTSTSQLKAWERPSRAPEAGGNKTQADVDLWRNLVDRIIAAAKTYGWSKAEVARRINMPDATFSQYFSGKYDGRLDTMNEKVGQWLDALEETVSLASTIPPSPQYMALRGSKEVMETLTWAQLCPDLVMITLGAGLGKTETCRQFCRTRPHAYQATVSENTKTTHGMLVELAEELDVREHNPAKLARAIGNKLKRTGGGTLLIVDEGQHLDDAALNQLRHFVDVYQCGVAVVGNSEVYGRFTQRNEKARSYAQLKSRIGKRLHRAAPYEEDLAAYIAAWGVTDPACVKFLTGIGMKGGAFRQIDKTMRMATMAAIGEGSAIELKHIQSAWKMRDVEDMA